MGLTVLRRALDEWNRANEARYALERIVDGEIAAACGDGDIVKDVVGQFAEQGEVPVDPLDLGVVDIVPRPRNP